MTNNRTSRLIATAATAAVASAATFASATVMRDETTVNMCVGKRATVVSAKPNGRCPKRARLVKISQTGPAGATGAAGAAGQDGASGTNGVNGHDGKDAPAPAVNLPGATAASIGDSNTVRNGPWGYANSPYIPQMSWFQQASMRVGQRVRLTNNFAVTGTRSDEMLSQQLPKVLALTPRPAVVSVMAGTNDISQGRNAAEIIASLDATYAALTKNGIRVVAGTVLPSTQWTNPTYAAVVAEVNTWIRARPDVEVVDFNAALSDAAGAPKPGVLMDGTHISPRGAALMGQALAPVLERIAEPVNVLPGAGSDLLAGEPVVVRGDGTDVSVTDDFAPGDRVVALVKFTTDRQADFVVQQIEATVAAEGTNSTAKAFSDAPGYDGPEATLTTVPRTGVLMTPALEVPAGTSALSVAVRVSGGTVTIARVSLVKVP